MYFPLSKTGKFHAPVSVNLFKTVSIESSKEIEAGGIIIKLLMGVVYISLSNMISRTSSRRTTPIKKPSSVRTGKIFRFDLGDSSKVWVVVRFLQK